MSDYIPPEVLVEILLRLPSKSLIRFSCVCKLWYSLITSSKFISMYTHFNSIINRHKNAQFFIRHYSRTHGKEIFSHHFDHDLSFSNCKQLDCPLRSNRGYLVDIVGSCNGLICLSDSDASMDLRSIVLWNPSLGKFKVLPVRSSSDRIKYDIVLGFGFDFRSIDYKVVAILSLGKLREVDIFALSENSWRSTRAKVSLPSFHITKSPQAFVNGNIHWIGYNEGTRERQKKSIVAVFDVVNEVFGELGMPNELANENMYDPDCIFSIVKFGKSLSLIRYDEKDGPSFNRCCIWVMKEYGEAESWIKQYTIFPYSDFWKTLDLRRNGQILLATSYGELVSFDVKSKRVNGLKLYGEARSFYVDTYVESLVLSRGSNKILGQASSSNASSHKKA